MISSSSTVYATIIALFMAMICSSLILFSGLINQGINVYENKLILHNRTINALQHSISACKVFYHEFEKDEILSDNECEVFSKSQAWGAYDVITIKTKLGKSKLSASIISGGYCPTYQNCNFYLINSKSPLFLAGEALVEGTIATSIAGLRRAIGNEKAYSREKLFDGVSKTSLDSLPMTYEGIYRNNYLLTKGVFKKNDSIVIRSNTETLSINREFEKNTLVILSKDSINLLNDSLYNNIIVYSEESIFIGSEAKLENIILISPNITVSSGFSGSCQLISNNNIIIEKGAKLLYPSVIIHLDDKQIDNIGSSVVLAEDVNFCGTILMLEMKNGTGNSLLKVSKGATANGFIYCQTKMELLGNINGNLYLNKFVSFGFSSYQENLLLNGKIKPWDRMSIFGSAKSDNSQAKNFIIKYLK